jgi:tetratricopeptide (TPR) repeat protein
MSRSVLAGIVLAAWGSAAAAWADETAYYQAIQGESPAVTPAAFGKLERAAYESFRKPEVYPPLIEAFAGTSERIWAVIYGEVYAGISDDERERRRIGALVFETYDAAVKVVSDDKAEVSLTRHWAMGADQSNLPFEMKYEMTMIPGLVPDALASARPVTIASLGKARLELLSHWREKDLPETELLRWQERIVQSGHFAAYNYWLFAAARPEEFEAYRKASRADYDAWVAWRRANALRLDVPDFQRPLLDAEDPELELLSAGRRLLGQGNPVEALRKSFDVVARRLDARHSGSSDTLYCARGPAETLYYLGLASAEKRGASVLAPTWSDAHYLKGYALLELGRLAESREALERAVALSPGNSQYLSELGYTYQVEKNWSESLATYTAAESAAEMSPDEVRESDASRAMRGQGFVLVELGRLDEAEAIYRKAIATDPGDQHSAGELQYIERLRATRP